MKKILSIYIDENQYEFLRRIAIEKNTSINAIINDILDKTTSTIKFSKPNTPREYIIIKCEKCGAEYSSRMPTCPVCEPDVIKAWREEQEKRKAEIFESEDIKNILNTFAENGINQESINELIERIMMQYNFEISESEIIQKVNEIKKSKQELSEQEKKKREEYESTLRQIFSDIEIKDMLMKFSDIRENMKRPHNNEEMQNIKRQHEDVVNEIIQRVKQKFDIDIRRRDIAVALRYLNENEEKTEVSV
jgi:hypothetical protein